ncbi:MAG TPA: CsgG/HfaB family protein [Candidatus Hydrogenedentes bacterium]|nr:CsgG/HfaB family protein [Candidatus Hydrogenedentota bacterium]
MVRKIAVVLVAGILLGSCAAELKSAYTRDGVTYGVTKGVFRGRWWSYYERGSSFLAGKFYDEAVKDFQIALKGRKQDSWRARTYGLHFVEYFPNRELGIAYFHLNRLDEAEQCLNRSLEEMDTIRGHYYLDMIKKKKIQEGKLKDDTAPEVGIVLPKETIIASRELTFEVNAKDDVGVAKVTVNGTEVPQRGSAEKVDVKKEVLLKEGPQKIDVAVTDLAEKKVEQQVEVTVDLTGPTIGVFAPIEPTVTEEGTVILDGASVDKNGLSYVGVSERSLGEPNGKPRMPFNTELALGDGENTFIVAARDVAGNETRSAVKVFKGNPNSPEAKLWLLKQKHPEKLQLALSGTVPLEILLSATADPVSEIRLKSPTPDRPYRHNRTLCISGEVVTQTKVAALTINGEPFQELTGAPKESFNRRIPIDEAQLKDGTGKLNVAIHAEDSAGAALDKTVEVDVRPVQLAAKESHMPVAVLAFAGQGVDTSVGALLRTTTEAQMVQQERFRVLDRTRLQEVLTEQQLAAALADPNQAITLGKVTPAQAFLVADVFPRDEKGIEIKARVLSPETSDVIATLDAFVDNRDNSEAVNKACENLVAQLTKLYPRLSGEVMAVRNQDLLLNWTKEDGVREGAYVLIVHEEEPWIDQTTGEVLQPGEFVEVGRAKIMSVMSNGTKAQTVAPTKEGAKIDQGLPAITM